MSSAPTQRLKTLLLLSCLTITSCGHTELSDDEKLWINEAEKAKETSLEQSMAYSAYRPPSKTPTSEEGRLSLDDNTMRLLLSVVHSPEQWRRLKHTLDEVTYNGALTGMVAHSPHLLPPPVLPRDSSPAVYMRWIPDPEPQAVRDRPPKLAFSRAPKIAPDGRRKWVTVARRIK